MTSWRGPVLAACLTLTAAGILAAPALAEGPSKEPHVVLDAGHGGEDLGAPSPALAARCGVPWGPVEKDRTLQVAREVRAILEASGLRVSLTRDEDLTVPLPARIDLINRERPDLVVSIHANAAPSCGSGVEVWYSSLAGGRMPNVHAASSRRLARRLAQSIHDRLGLRLRRDAGTADIRGGFAMVREPLVPSVLVEMAFMTNLREAAMLRDRPGDFAQAIAAAIRQHLEAEGPRARVPAYDQPFLTDADLEDHASMTVQEIRAFLAGQGSYLARPVPDVDGLVFDAAEVIARAAERHGISPKVLLVSMQKESSSVSRSERPPDRTLRFLMGCRTPSTAREQIECTAARLRLYHDQLSREGATLSGWRVGVPRHTQDGVLVAPATRAVAGQFSYTPYAGARWGGNVPGGVSLFYLLWERFGF